MSDLAFSTLKQRLLFLPYLLMTLQLVKSDLEVVLMFLTGVKNVSVGIAGTKPSVIL